MRIEDELRGIGCTLDSDDFIERLCELFVSMHRDSSVDDFLCRWWDVAQFCAVFCFRLGIPFSREADNLISRTLMNRRKDGDLNLCDRAGQLA